MLLDLESILKEWEEDCKIPQHQLDETQRLTPSLHAKYLQYLSLTKLNLKRAEHAQKALLLDKFNYYNGRMDQQTIQDKGWNYDPFDGLKVMKSDLDRYYNADIDIQRSEEKVAYLKTIIETLEEIIQTLRWRHATIKNIIEWRRFESGG
jgi:hypothetical protein